MTFFDWVGTYNVTTRRKGKFAEIFGQRGNADDDLRGVSLRGELYRRAVDTPADGAVVRKNSETVEDCRGGGALRAVFFYYFIKSVGNYDADL